MIKGKSTWKYNKLLTARRNYFSIGGATGNSITGTNNFGLNAGIATNNPGFALEIAGIGGTTGTAQPSLGNSSSNKKSGFLNTILGTFNNKGAATIGALGSAIGNTAGAAMSGGKTSTAGSVISKIGSIANIIPGIGGLASGALGIIGGLANTMFGSKLNKENIAKVESDISRLNNFESNVSDYNSLAQNWADANPAMGFSNSYIGKDGWFSNKAKKKAQELRAQVEAGNAFMQNTLLNNADNIENTQAQNMLSNYAAFGGKIGTNHTHGGDFSMPGNFITIGNGGSHENNPFEGVPMGVDEQGVPNLVEEGETIFNDYVFSKRLKVPGAITSKYKLRSKEGLTFADVSKKLAEESEERPNDPLSKRGLMAIMADLASAQEALKSTQYLGSKYAFGGNLFVNGGYAYNNTSNSSDIVNNELFKPFWNGSNFDFTAMHADNSEYRKRLDPIAAILYKRKQDPKYKYTDEEAQALTKYMESVNTWNPNKKYKNIDALTYDKIIGDSLTTSDGKTFTLNPKSKKHGLALDSKRGGHYYGISALDPAGKIIEKHMLRNPNGAPTAMPESDIYYKGTKNGYKWEERVKDKYTIANNGAYEETKDKDGNIIRTYYYDPVKSTSALNRYYMMGDDNQYHLVEGDNPMLTIQNAGKYRQTKTAANNNNGTDYYFDPTEEFKPGKYADWLRYAPAIGFGIGTLTDALGLTNKPDYSDANAVLEATRSAGTYNPVKFNPVSNYLTYNPFDRDYYLNKMSAEAGASRRAIANTSGGNRTAAMAGILAADNNYLNQIGALSRQAEEYNLAQRQQVEDFNRSTNITNSQGFLQADTANQSALANMREFNLKGNLTAAEMRERARLAADQNKSANISGLFQTLGDIGFEEKNARMRDWAISKGIWGPGVEDYGRGSSSQGKAGNIPVTTNPSTPQYNIPDVSNNAMPAANTISNAPQDNYILSNIWANSPINPFRRTMHDYRNVDPIGPGFKNGGKLKKKKSKRGLTI